MSLIIERRYSDFGVPNILQEALRPSAWYLEEDQAIIRMILDRVDPSTFPNTWGSAIVLAKIDRYRDAVLRHEEWIRWKLDHYERGSICYI